MLSRGSIVIVGKSEKWRVLCGLLLACLTEFGVVPIVFNIDASVTFLQGSPQRVLG